MRNRKWVSLFLAALLAIAPLLEQGSVSYAAEADKTLTSEAAETGEFREGDVVTPGDGADMSGNGNGADPVTDPSQIPSPMSLLPIPEVRAYLVLNGYSEEDLKALPVKTVLERLKDFQGNPIEIPADATVAWGYWKDEDGYQDYDAYHVVSREDTLDLTYYYDTTSYTFQLIIGKGTQLDYDATRYIVSVYLSDMIMEDISYSLYTEDVSTGGRSRVPTVRILEAESDLLAEQGVPVNEVRMYLSTYVPGKEYILGFFSTLSQNIVYDNIDVEVYPMKNFLDYYQNGSALEGEITAQILNQSDLSNEGGYKSQFTDPGTLTDPLEADNFFCLVYREAESGALLAFRGLLLSVCSSENEVRGDLYTYEDGSMKKVTRTVSRSSSSASWNVDLGQIENGADVWNGYLSYGDYCYLEDQYYSDEKYYYVMDENPQVDKVFLGQFSTLENAQEAGAADVTAQVLPADKSTPPYGYKSNYYNLVYFTVFFKDGSSVMYYVNTNYNPRPQSADDYSDAPLADSADPYFRVSGVENTSASGNYISSYVVENSYRSVLDTLYGYGYQTVFLNDTDVDLSTLKPVFYKGDNVKVTVGEEQISGESVQDFSKGPVYYAVYVGDNLRNYQVTYVKKHAGGPQLFVNGPEKREIFLTEYFENRHDVLIANVGDQELTGLKVEILNAVNVKLDDYWTVGGENNDKLAAFTQTYSSGSQYGELPNLAKIRLLPDGEGEISGTLKITADGQEPVLIELTGYASNPRIITEELSKGVKWVPYSFTVQTNNMYSWAHTTFSYEGVLPEGLELYPATGEIYGVPLETGTFELEVYAEYDRAEFSTSYADFVLTVDENSNVNVYQATDSGYELEDYIGSLSGAGDYDFILSDFSDQLFVSAGVIEEFQDFWLNGEKLTEGVDYTKESGSTRITIRSQTLASKVSQDGLNTIAAEFRVNGDRTKDLKRTAQNFRVDLGWVDPSQNNNQSSNAQNNGSAGGGDTGSSLVTVVVHLLDTNGSPLANTTVELHSTPKVAVSNGSGYARFENVEGGQHTLIVKDKSGNEIAKKNFTITLSDNSMLSGQDVIAKWGGAITVEVQVNGNGMTFLSLAPKDVYRTISPKTGDPSNLTLWLQLLMLSMICAAGAWIYRRKVSCEK